MGDIGRYDPCRYCRRAVDRLFDLPCRRGDNGGDNRRMIDGIRRDPERAPLQCPCHMACGIAGYPITINILPGQKVDSKPSGRRRADTGRRSGPQSGRMKIYCAKGLTELGKLV